MGEAKSTTSSQSHRLEQRQSLTCLWADLTVVRQRGMGKVARVRKSLPMYRPSRHPVGRDLRVIDRETAGAAEGPVDYREVLPPRTVPAGARETIEAPALYACSVSRGTLIAGGVHFYGVMAENNLLVAEISDDRRSSEGEWASFKRLKRLPTRIRVGSGVSLLTGGGGVSNYAHWLYDVLPRLHLLRRAGLVTPGARYLVPPIDTEFKHTSLDRLGISPDDCIEVGGPVAIVGDTIAASSGHRSHGRVEPWIPEFLRDAFLREAPQTGLRLYVNRRDTKIRRVLNEEALESALAERGFRSISAADFDFQDKMDLYSSADFIVAPHGAGLANLAFCSPGTHIVEIDGDDWSDPWYGDVARAMDLSYTLIRGFRTVSPAWLPDIVRHVEVDVERVVGAVDAILA
jgi:capsular polysaccharide biosynthesis protein